MTFDRTCLCKLDEMACLVNNALVPFNLTQSLKEGLQKDLDPCVYFLNRRSAPKPPLFAHFRPGLGARGNRDGRAHHKSKRLSVILSIEGPP